MYSAPSRQRAKNDATLLQVLGLYLILLAIFIVLYNFSEAAGNRAEAVSSSVRHAFARTAGPEQVDRPVPGQEGTGGSEAQYLSEIGRAVESVIPVVQVDTVTPGEVIAIRVPPETLFQPALAEMTEEAGRLAERVAELLASSPGGSRFSLQVEVPGAGISTGDLATGEPLPISRAGRFAERVVAAGAPPGRVAAGLVDTQETDVVLVVRRSSSIASASFETLDGETVE